ncbi:ATP synthase I [Bacillus wiedmannii]|nr:ATP synthase I [Bacillus wiedmannii]PHE97002.1 ATP synthase I [Bacillus wiedmannii]
MPTTQKTLSAFLKARKIAISIAFVLYEIEHHAFMWTFAAGIMAGYFLIIINLGYYSMRDAKE